MESRPYVNHSMLRDNVGKLVSVIGKVIDINPTGNQLKMLMSDEKEVKVSLKDNLEELLQGFIQVTAQVENDGTLTAEHLISFGNGEIDLNVYNQAVELAKRYPKLFTFGHENGLSY